MPEYATVEEMYHHIELLFDYNPPEISPKPRSPESRMAARTSFYDKHINEHLTLKRVVIVPSLLPNISSAVDVAFESLKVRNIKLPLCHETWMVSTPKSRESGQYTNPGADEESLARAYQTMTSNFCLTIASMVMLSPRAPRWTSLIIWKQSLSDRLDSDKVWDREYGLQLRDLSDSTTVPISKDAVSSLGDDMLQTLRASYSKTPHLALWDILPPVSEAQNALKTMDDFHLTFQHERCSDLGYTPSPSIKIKFQDAKATSWGCTLSSFVDPFSTSRDASARRQSHSAGNANHHEQKPSAPSKANKASKRSKDADTPTPIHWPSITTPKRSTQKDKNTSAKEILQRAWSRAVHMDQTFIILYCGNFERIGIRHRETQTLFLSELIDVAHCKNPGYGKIHLGLYLSILHDVMDRTRQLSLPKADGKSKSRKRRRSDAEIPGNTRKRPKTRAAVAKQNAAEKERRAVLEVGLTVHNNYNSPTPAIFSRSGRLRPGENVKLGPQEYLSIIITSDIAAGATGNVHSGTLRLLDLDHRTQTLPVVVKFSFQEEDQERMRHEFRVYQKLTAVDGVPAAIGLFEDLESNVIALVMTHAGTCLTDLFPGSSDPVIEEPERSAFLQVLEDIHFAGVQHRDLRAENLSLDDNGKAYIIDFDRAKLYPTDGAKKRELKTLADLLDGDPSSNEFPSAPTTEDSVD